MIEVFKVVSGKYDSSVSIQIPINEISSTRGNKYKLRIVFDLTSGNTHS